MRIKIIITFVFSVLMSVSTCFSQGLFSSSEETQENEAAVGVMNNGMTRGLPEKPQEPGSPIGEGLLILTALAGGYSLIRNRKSNKK